MFPLSGTYVFLEFGHLDSNLSLIPFISLCGNVSSMRAETFVHCISANENSTRNMGGTQ